jgi:hypothetical protein
MLSGGSETVLQVQASNALALLVNVGGAGTFEQAASRGGWCRLQTVWCRRCPVAYHWRDPASEPLHTELSGPLVHQRLGRAGLVNLPGLSQSAMMSLSAIPCAAGLKSTLSTKRRRILAAWSAPRPKR